MDFEDSGCKSFNATKCNRDLAMKSSDRLADLFKKSGFLKLGKQRLRSYWQERLDYVLWQTNYDWQKKPAKTFSQFVAACSPYRRLWSQMVVDYLKSYPEQKLPDGNDPTAIEAQLRAIQRWVHETEKSVH